MIFLPHYMWAENNDVFQEDFRMGPDLVSIIENSNINSNYSEFISICALVTTYWVFSCGYRKFFVFISSGTIVLHNLELRIAVMSLDTTSCPVLHGDWSTTNESLVGAVVWKQYCLIWNMSESSLPSDPIRDETFSFKKINFA